MLIGIEQEFVFKDAAGTYLDFETGRYPVFQGIVDAFPLHPEDAGVFECKSLESAPKRLYVEGFERYDLAGTPVETTPKGLEIRTLPHPAIDPLIDEFVDSYHLMTTAAARCGLEPVLTSHHPFRSDVVWARPLNQAEHGRRDGCGRTSPALRPDSLTAVPGRSQYRQPGIEFPYSSYYFSIGTGGRA